MENIFSTAEISGRAMTLLAVIFVEYTLVLVAVLTDLISGLRKAWQRGEATRSKALRRTVDKLVRYYNLLAVLTVVDAMQIVVSLYLRAVEGYELPSIPLFTLIGAVGIAFIEVKSIFEKSTDKEKADLSELASLLENTDRQSLKN